MGESDTNRSDRTVDRLARVTAAYGADPARWPAEERAALQEVLADMDAAAEQLDEESALDRLLDMVSPADPPPGAVDRILAAAGIARAGEVVAFPRPSSAPVGLRLKPALGLIAASLLLGVVTGTTRFADPLFLDPAGERMLEVDDLDSALIDLDVDLGEDEESS